MRIIKLSPADDEMHERKDVLYYFEKTMQRGPRRGKFGLTEAKARMQGIGAGTLLLFCYKGECMFMARAAGPIQVNPQGGDCLPLKVSTLHAISGVLEAFQRALHRARLTAKELVHTQAWPELPEECETITLAYFSSPGAADHALQLHQAMDRLYHDVGEKLSYWGLRYHRALKTHGGLTWARRMLRPKKKIDDGLAKLKAAGYAETFSVEAIVQQPRFRGLFTAAELAEARRRLDEPVPDLVARAVMEVEAEAVVDQAINPAAKRRGQAFVADPRVRKCIELRGMLVAAEYLTKEGFVWKDVSKTESCDYEAIKGGRTHVVEVKATTGPGQDILLTAAELKLHRKRHPDNWLIVVHGVLVSRSGDEPLASGGTAVCYRAWAPPDSALEALAYRCSMK